MARWWNASARVKVEECRAPSTAFTFTTRATTLPEVARRRCLDRGVRSVSLLPVFPALPTSHTAHQLEVRPMPTPLMPRLSSTGRCTRALVQRAPRLAAYWVASLLLLPGCQQSSNDGAEPEGASTASAAPTGAPDQDQSAVAADRQIDEGEQRADTGSLDPGAASPAPGEREPPPPLEEWMRAVGYTDRSEIALDQFVHTPPGATGEAGTFGRGDQTVRVASIAYPNERYARPHVTDIEERMRLLPESGDAVAAHGRFVIQVSASSRERADEVRDAMVQHAGW